MKLLGWTKSEPYRAKLRYPVSKRVKRFIVKVGVSMFLLWLLLPQVFYGVLDVGSGIIKGLAHQRVYYAVRRSRGRTVADLWEVKNVWGEAIKGMNPMTWGR